MSSSSYIWQEAYDKTTAVPHSGLGRSQEKRKPADENAAASLHTTASDYARFIAAILSRDGLRPESFDLMMTPAIKVTNRKAPQLEGELHWGLGWGLQLSEGGKALWHWGDNGPFKAFTLCYPDERIGFVFFANSQDGLSIAGVVADAFHPDVHTAVNYLDYERFDDPLRTARMELADIFMTQKTDAGMRAYDELRRDMPEQLAEKGTNSIGYFLLREEQTDAAIAIFKKNVESYPESPNVFDSLAEAYVAAEELNLAAENYEKAAAMDKENTQAAKSAKFIREQIKGLQRPVYLSKSTLQRYAGEYGERRIMLSGDTLVYQREGRPARKLTAMALDTFLVEDTPTFRLRFVADDAGVIVKVEGHYIDGRIDESVRTN
jgi:hypothetical protein